MTKNKADWSRRNERNIPLSEGFEICFCLIVSEREKRRRRESTDKDSEKLAYRLTENQSVCAVLMRSAAQSENALQKRKKHIKQYRYTV